MTSINSTTGMVSDASSSQREAFRAKVRSLVAAAREARGTTQASEAARATKASGTVSSAISSAWKSGLSTAGAAAIGAGGTSIARSAENAEAIVGVLARAVNDYNGKFELQEIPTREDYMASRDSWISKVTAMGLSEELIKRGVESNFGEGGYERALQTFEVHNQGLLRYSELAVDAISGSTDHIKGAFGVKVQISYDEEGHASVAPFDIYYSNGRKMLSYGENGSLTSYNADGSVKLALSNTEAAKIPMGYYRS
jgi:hypothetical protein